nr:hypothetical protein [Acidovorax sp. D4N7]
MRFPSRIIPRASACTALALALTACGGGSSPTTPNAATRPGISGVAAIGAPIAGASVACKCASGKYASATTAADGSFDVEMADSDFPCALSVSGGSVRGKPLGAALHSVAHAAGTANITPLTDLMVASLASEDPAKWYARATQADIGAAITEAKLAMALEKLKAALVVLPDKPVLPADFHPVTTLFKAHRSDAADDLLERYGRALSIAELSQDEAAARMAAGEKLTQTAYTAHAFTVPGWTSFPIGLKTLPDGSEALTLPDPTLGMQVLPIRGRDAEGNITAVDRSGAFTSILSLMGNRIGMLSGRDSHLKNTVSPSDESSAHYVYLSDEFTEVDHREVLGKRFAVYQDSMHLMDVLVGTDGKLTQAGAPSERLLYIAQLFSPEGSRDGQGEDATIARARAYKHTADGKTTYVVVMVVALDPDVPEALPAEQGVLLMVSR